jgi:hypothetical protein
VRLEGLGKLKTNQVDTKQINTEQMNCSLTLELTSTYNAYPFFTSRYVL